MLKKYCYKIIINGKEEEICLKQNAFSRSIRISIYPDGRVNVTFPRSVSRKQAQFFVQKQLDWIAKKISENEKKTDGQERMLRKNNPEEYKRLKFLALEIVRNKVDYFNRFYGFSYARITVRNQCSRWGSCSSNGTLSFNYKIIFLDQQQSDYLVVHELCHLKEMNHSKKFWDLVAKTIPNHKILSRQLRQK
jgi:predicted metal-dependent hydrolase